MIHVKGVTKTFDKEIAVQEVTMDVKQGSIYGLVGSNGAGKTTLLKMLAGIYRPDQGEIFIGGEPIFENVAMKRNVVFISDALYFFPQVTIEQMASYYRSFYPNWSDERFETLQRVFPLEPSRKIHRLSKGMQRQVSFWLSLSCLPSVFILDEPMDGLDPVMRQKIKNLLFQDVAERNMTVIISSHNLREIEDMCDHIGMMHEGKIILEKDIDVLKSDTHKVQLAFDEEQKEEKILNDLTIVHKEKRGSVLLLIVRGEKDVIERTIRAEKPLVFDMLPLTLEEMFIYEMGGVGYEVEQILY
ncbi:ABC transporter ATP-binding protein [Aliibacillus thermotolerans]|uniref:ABC transporter ATP-binding protein n=1 Tax=Aliibacillus thermotolerans TaxID=1834418 RepID=A0ABW0U814_9BACI|nr:ABC transporter ATP-binding protein [Aliibacillus thermotolerans]MDA3130215.1 ATP-binding cassette domain-containing protein [Aliibacillus thermotolerans]